jgi:hypothetical protein
VSLLSWDCPGKRSNWNLHTCFFLPLRFLAAHVFCKFYVLLTVHLGIILFNNQLDAQFFFEYGYFNPLHVSSIQVLIIRRFTFINTISGICHSM